MKKLFDNALLCLWRALMYAPVILTLGALLPGGGQLKCGLFYLCGQALALILSFIPARARVASMIITCLAYAAAGFFCLGVVGAPFMALIIVLSIIAFALTLRAQGAAMRYDTREMIAGAIIQVLPPLIIKLSGMEARVDYTAMMWAGLAYFVMCPYIMNSMSVRDGMSLRGRGGKPIGRISSKNRAMVTGLIVIAVLVASADKIRQAFECVGEFIMYWVGQFIAWLSSLMQSTEDISGESVGESSDVGGGLPMAEPSWFAKLMEQIVKYVALIFVAVAICFALWKLFKLLKKVAARISEWAKRFAQGVREDYTEEREQLMDWGEVRGEMLDSLKESLKKFTTREKKWADMDARERVRSAVKQLYKKRGIGISGIECLSAREAFAEMNLGEQERGRLGDMYDEARYSSHEITDAQAEEARRTVK